jgi:predicted phosphoribosyltransferase
MTNQVINRAIRLPFRDRTEAGRLLAAELLRRRIPSDSVILALPRGGVPVGAEVAEALHVPLDIVPVRKLGVPWHPELAMGAMAGETCVFDRQLIDALNIPSEDVDSVVKREARELARREILYRGGQPLPNLSGKAIVLVDDGIATGLTMVAAIRHAGTGGSGRVIVAVPVASPDACRRLQREVDDLICLATPEPFSSVGEWYVDFRQVTDEEVQSTLKRCRAVLST